MTPSLTKIVYILGEFPSTTEFFIRNEINGLVERGLPVRILALTKPKVRPDTLYGNKTLQGNVIYYSVTSPLNLIALIYCTFKHTRTYMMAQLGIGRLLFSKPLAALQQVKHLMAGSYFIFRLRNESKFHVHAHFASVPSTIARMMAGITNFTYSLSAHANDIYANNEALVENISKARFVITCTKANHRFLTKVSGRENIQCIYHGVDLASWPYKRRHGVPQGEPVKLLMAGRLVEKKGVTYLLKAIHALKGRIAVNCTIVGEGPEQTKLKEECRRLGIEAIVYFEGSKTQQELLAYYQAHHVFVLPCLIAANGDRDGLPNVLAEALATGIPVVSTSLSGVGELIDNGITGLLVPSGDTDALAEAIEQLTDDKSLYQAVSLKGREKMELLFDVERGNQQVYDLFKQLD